jgi:tetratricopeptide (TPR) repeat protein
VVVGGTGNLKLLKQPVVQFPKDFDSYDPEITDKTKLTSNGVEGNMIYDFIAVPRNQGEYTIPPVELVYYDTGSNSYKTAKSQSFKLTVTPGEGNATVSDFTDMRDKDIHPIKKGKADIHKAGQFFYESTPYWICLIVPLLIFMALLVLFRRRALEHADIIKMKAKNANKVATKRLRTANKMMLRGENNLFYDEVLRTLWGYVGDKLNMPQAELTRDNVSDKLAAAGVGQETVEKFVGALDECEYERYAPGDAKGNMNKTFESAMTAIMEIENAMKKNKHGRVSVMLVFLALMIPAASHAVTKENADAEYTKGNYQQAIRDYEQLLQYGVSAEIYYNLGNAYFRTDNITKAILNYERAHMLAPGDEDINFNLQFARSKTIDRITASDEMFFVNWYQSLVTLTTVDRWAFTAVLSIVLVLVLLLVFLFAESITLRKMGFYGAVAFLVLFILANVFAYQQKRMLENRKGAIVTASSVNVMKSPADKADTSFVLHEGTRVDITDKSIKGWCGIRIADGREGWMQADKMEEI